MNVRPAIDSTTYPAALSVSFNQDSSCFSVGMDSGFSIFNSDPCELQVSRDLNAGIHYVQMLGKTNFIALIGNGKSSRFPQNKVMIWDDAKQKIALQIQTPADIRKVCISKSYICLISLNIVEVHKFQRFPELWHSFETSDNPLGLCCLGNQLVAFPGRTPGQIQLVELTTGNVSIIPAHGSALRALEMSKDGRILASASQTGTLIRIFATHNCARITELRRGVDNAIIFSLAISPSNKLLAATSDKATIHIFDIPKLSTSISTGPSNHLEVNSASSTCEGKETNNSRKWGVLGRMPLLPRVFSDIYSFASAHFEIGDDQLHMPSNVDSGLQVPKGVLGWIDDEALIVLSAGLDSRWEKFLIVQNGDGTRHCVRKGWKKYLNIG